MAIGADRGHIVAARDRLPVNALVKGLRNIGVAFPTRRRNVELRYRRLGIIGGDDVMGERHDSLCRRRPRSNRSPWHGRARSPGKK